MFSKTYFRDSTRLRLSRLTKLIKIIKLHNRCFRRCNSLSVFLLLWFSYLWKMKNTTLSSQMLLHVINYTEIYWSKWAFKKAVHKKKYLNYHSFESHNPNQLNWSIFYVKHKGTNILQIFKNMAHKLLL